MSNLFCATEVRPKIGGLYTFINHSEERHICIFERKDNEYTGKYIASGNGYIKAYVPMVSINDELYCLSIGNYIENGTTNIDVSYSEEVIFTLNNIYVRKSITENEICEFIEDKLSSINKSIEDTKQEIRDKSNSFAEVSVPDDIEIQSALKPIVISGTTLQDKYSSIVSATSELTTKINSQVALSDTKELALAFNDARKQLLSVKSSSMSSPGIISNTIGKFFGSNKYTSKLVERGTEAMHNSKSVQDNIDYLFGLVHEKYEKLVEVGTALQASKFQFIEQISTLEELAIESRLRLSEFVNEIDIPMTEIALNTQILSSIEKYKAKLSKIDGAIMAVQATIVALGKNLPSHKSDLEDEMAIGDLLSSVDDYQTMYQGIVDLVSDVTKQTAENTHKVIENLMDVQINDTHTLQYLEDTTKRGEKFASMLAEKTQTLADKTVRDAKFIADIASGTPVLEAKRKNPLLK